MIVGFTTVYAISAYHHYCCEFESRSWGRVLDTTFMIKLQPISHVGKKVAPGWALVGV
jgi:hypothetical protein